MGVFAIGSFDDIRSRDIRFLEEAAKIGPLTIRLNDAGGAKFSFEERRYILSTLRFVGAVERDEGALPVGAVVATREMDAAAAQEFAERHGGHNYRVISENELEGFPCLLPEPVAEQRRVAVSGCYDWLHSGHVRFFEEASAYGALHVFLGSDATIAELKGAGHPQFPELERKYVVGSVRSVSAAHISTGSGMLDFAEDVLALKPDFFVVNEDGDRHTKRDFCREAGIEYVVLKRLPADGLPSRSSTALRGF